MIICSGAPPSAFNPGTRLASFATITLIPMPSPPMQKQPSPDLSSWGRSSLQPGAFRSKIRRKNFDNVTESVDSLPFLFRRDHFPFLLEQNLPWLSLFRNGLAIVFSPVQCLVFSPLLYICPPCKIVSDSKPTIKSVFGYYSEHDFY